MRLLLCMLAAAAAPGQPPGLSLHRVAGGLSNPLGIAFPADGTGRMFVLEQAGRLRVVRNGALLDRPFLDWRSHVSSGGERGLLGVAFPPGYADKRYFYINYTDPAGNTVISRLRVSADPDVADSASEEIILAIDQPFANHNGGNLAFSPKDGYLYIGMGDGGSAGDPLRNAQNPASLLGKMLRIDVESGAKPYTVPPDNPFVGQQGYRPEIWAVGLRNPWKYSFDRETFDLWIGDVGQDRAEEIDFQPAASTGGENYGWPRMEGLRCYPPGSSCDQQGLTLPVFEYGRGQGISVIGGYVYRGSRHPALRGVYVYGDFGSGALWSFVSGGAPAAKIDSGLAISAFGQDENGELYVADHRGGAVYLITAGPPSTTPGAIVNAASFGPGIVPGSLATLFGTGLTPLPGVLAATRIPLPTQLVGVSVTMNRIPAPLVALAAVNGQEQINFQVPWELAGTSQADVVVTANEQSSAAISVPLARMQPEIFAITRSGEALTVWATGLGPVGAPPATGQSPAGLQATADTPEVVWNGISLPVTFSGLAPNYVGLYQINATARPDAAGDVVLKLGGVASRPRAIVPQ